MKRSLLVLASASTLSLAACGAPPPKAAAVAAPVGVFTSATDCAESGKLDLKGCTALIQQVVVAHQQTAKSYISMRLCEEAEGTDKCERADPKTFRRSLLAFQVTFNTPPTVLPLYAAKEKGAVGFSTFDKAKTVLAVDETIIFSEQAKIVAQSHVETN
jgi:hypothetical protein